MSDTIDRTDANLSTSTDFHVGARIRALRVARGMTQQDLGQMLGVTSQQIEEFETGASRLSASRLLHISNILDAEPLYFFEGLVDPAAKSRSADLDHDDLSTAVEGLALFRAFLRIEDPELRRRIIDLIEAMAGDVDDE